LICVASRRVASRRVALRRVASRHFIGNATPRHAPSLQEALQEALHECHPQGNADEWRLYCDVVGARMVYAYAPGERAPRGTTAITTCARLT
jgi:hypothetical protein